MSKSPCSIPDWLRILLPMETPRQQRACRRHDTLYEQGGSRRMRLATDHVFSLDQLGCDPVLLGKVLADLAAREADVVAEGAMEPDRAEQYFWGVRQYAGAPNHWKGGDAPGAPPPRPPQETEPQAP